MKGIKCDDRVHFHGFFLSCLNRLQNHEMGLLCVILWRVWLLRNQVVHGLGRQDMESDVNWCRGYLKEYSCVRTMDIREIRLVLMEGIRWQPQREGCYKVNTDTAIYGRRNLVGVGLMIRDQAGQALSSRAQLLDSGFSPKVAETVAVLRGIHFASDSGLLPAVLSRLMPSWWLSW
ncbi:hypothetical protein Dsin_022982 [Dipteronia sinensis]|uniref:RNase H type-1 domain-containing protein n=1 Tax=Dipteronia sinensis TaxID=43782 RepID=A0AAE0A3H7_9ROSI|nr:hypothetical protein Dsin_022982 [Dipteronia sinensis]